MEEKLVSVSLIAVTTRMHHGVLELGHVVAQLAPNKAFLHRHTTLKATQMMWNASTLFHGQT